jgi:molybdopterin-guanine dinucleotide biosynthesis protein A
MGRDKALLKLDGETLAARGLRKLRNVCAEVAIAGGSDELRGLARLIPDRWPLCGPLGGIVSALEQSAYEWNLFLAVDMPFVPELKLRELVDRLAVGRQLLSVPQVDGRVHPLCGVYSREALPVLRGELEAGRYKVLDAIRASNSYGYVEWLEPEWVRNLNTPEEFAEAQNSAR